MRLLKIKISGITSIKESLTIDFDEVVKGHDLFAITGATGSGKSSILTSISLALFGKGHKKLPVENYVSLDKNKAFIELDFMANNQFYTTTWSCKIHVSKTSGKKRAETKRVLRDENNNIIDGSPEDVIGLNQEQFFKTVIINQGQFADFLTSSFTHRKAIIEQIYGSTELSLLAPTLRRRINEKNNEIEVLDARIEGTNLATPEEYEQNKKELMSYRAALNFNKEIAKKIQPFSEIMKQFHNSKIKIDEYNLLKEKTQQKLSNITEEFNKKSALYLSSFETFDKNLQSWEKEKESVRKAIKHKENIAQLNENIHDLKKSIEQKKSLFEEKELGLANLLPQVNEINNALETFQRDHNLEIAFKKLDIDFYVEYAHKHEKYDQALKELESAHKKLTDQKSTLKSQQETTQSEYTKVDKNWDEIIQKIKAQLSSNGQKTLNLATLKNEILQVKNNEKKSLIEIEENKKNLNRLNLEKDLLSKKIDETKDKIITEQDRRNKDLLKFAKSVCQHENFQQENCIVCDSPIKNTEDVDILEYDINNQLITEFEKSISACKTKRDHLHKEISRYEELNKSLLNENEKNSLFIKESIGKIFAEYDSEVSPSKFIKDVEALLSEKEKSLQKEIDNSIEMNQKQKVLSEKMRLLKEQTQEIDHQLKNLDTRMANGHKEIQEILNNTNSVFKRSWKIENIPQIRLFLEDIRKFNILEKERLSLLQAKEEIESFIKNDNEQISLKSQKSEEELEILNQLFPQHGETTPERYQNQKEAELKDQQIKVDELKKQQNEIDKEKNNLIQQISLLEENIKSLSLLISEYTSKINEYSQAIVFEEDNPHYQRYETIINNLSKLNMENSLKIDTEIIAHVDEKLSELFELLNEKIQELLQSVATLEERCKEYEKNLKEKESLRESKTKLTKQLEKLLNLKEVLNNDGFAKFALSFLEQKLLAHTNNELETMCEGRYKLIEKEVSKTTGPEFFVVDLWQNGLSRKVATLSGGETFLISLAMALSLAEMSRGKTDIDTFIIDEGFGTLDDQSIEEVLNVLLSIRSRGKQIGLISHVKKLTERIPVNIHMHKKNQGSSAASIVYN